MSGNNFKVSIIVPVYNVEQYVERCIQSCIRQDLRPDEYEIVVVNDGSKDNSLKVVENIASRYDNIKVFSQKNKGLSGARNTGLKHADGEYVWFVDSDDWIKDNCLGNIYNICKTLELDLLQICAANICNGIEKRRFLHKEEGVVKLGKDVLNDEIQFCTPFSIYSREFLLKNNLWFYEGIFHEDNEFSPRVFFMAEKVSSINDILYFVYQNPNSITRSFNPQKAFDTIKVLRSLHDFQQRNNPGRFNSFNKVITSTFNVALHEAIKLDAETTKSFESELIKNDYLYNHLLYSGSLLYVLEGLLLKLFKNRPMALYKFLNKLDKREIKK